jgi:isopentenyl diphosphate isomerase/L-lactate dehydrogenase-like FMN-dependent dehydrogenase
VDDPVCLADYERLAEERLEEPWLGYFAGGAGDERTMADNVEAFGRLRLRPRVLRDVGDVSTRVTTLGLDLALPVLVAPVAYQRRAHPDGEAATARATAAAGTAMCVSTLATATVEEVASAAPDATLLHQLYVFRDRGLTVELVERAVAAGCRAVVLTADLPVVGKRERELRGAWALPEQEVPAVAAARARGSAGHALSLFDPTVDWRYLEELSSSVDVPVLVKGVLTGEDAVLAAEHGAAGVVVSNHGGRQLDGVGATLDALPEVVEAAGDRLQVWLDGGVRRGSHVAAALALGASAVLVGRPAVWGLAAAGEEGVRGVLEILRDELETALALLGCRSPAELRRAHVAPA